MSSSSEFIALLSLWRIFKQGYNWAFAHSHSVLRKTQLISFCASDLIRCSQRKPHPLYPRKACSALTYFANIHKITFFPLKQIFANLLCTNSCQALQIKEIQNFDMVAYFILRIFSKNCSENISLVKSYVLFSSLSEVISVFDYLTAHILTLPLSLSLQHHRDVSTLRNTYCSSRDNLFSSQHPYHIGQPIALCNSSFRSSNALFWPL